MIVNTCSHERSIEMTTGNGSLYSGRVPSGRTTYFMDVRRAVNGRYYLTLTESRRTSDTGFDQNRIFLFEENVESFRDTLEQALKTLEDAAQERGALDDGTDAPARSGQRWTDEDEEELRTSFTSGNSLEDMAADLSRSTKAVSLRLEKMGLIPSSEDNETQDG